MLPTIFYDPPGAVEKVIDIKSHELLLQEYGRRIALCAQKMDGVESGPFFKAAESLLPGDRISEGIKSLLLDSIANERNRSICLWFIHWEQASQQTGTVDYQADNPYEPLIYLFEREGDMEALQETIATKPFRNLTLNELEKKPPVVRLNFKYLNCADEGKPIH
ncbi:hypothetical protein D3C81_286360 [compost metagenome]